MERFFALSLSSAFIVITTVLPNTCFADNVDECLLDQLKQVDDSVSVAELRASCEQTDDVFSAGKGVLSMRAQKEKRLAFNPYVITPHKMNYILPLTMSDNVNREVYSDFKEWANNIESLEAKYQLSIKVPLNFDNLVVDADGLYFGFTLQSWWQVYSSSISKPFRETNYQPEIFYRATLDWDVGGGYTGFMLGIEHQSNGRSQQISRSWNRIYTNFIYEKDNFAISFKPWWRLPEDEKAFDLDPDGDDNPDIDYYMGHFELSGAYKWNDIELSFKGRENFSKHHGSIELGITFPLWAKVRGYAQYTNGYGESLIDYNHKQQTIGLGFALSGIL